MTASPTFLSQQIKDSRIFCVSGVTSATPKIIDAKIVSTYIDDMNVPPIDIIFHRYLYLESFQYWFVIYVKAHYCQ